MKIRIRPLSRLIPLALALSSSTAFAQCQTRTFCQCEPGDQPHHKQLSLYLMDLNNAKITRARVLDTFWAGNPLEACQQALTRSQVCRF